MPRSVRIAPSEYWAAAPIDQIAAIIVSKFDDYKKWGVSTGYFDRIEASYDAYYAFNDDGTLRITRDEDEVAHFKDNQFKSLVRRLHILVTENKLAYQPRARNSDSKSQIDSDLARGLCEYYGDEKHMHRTLSEAVRGALVMLEYNVHAPWSLTEGYELTVDGGKVIQSGDQTFELYDAFNCARSTSKPESPWRILRQKVNRFDEAALHPEFADEILRADATPDQYDTTRLSCQDANQLATEQDDDMCWKYILYHARTPSMRQGRKVEVIGGQVLSDDELRYSKIPVFRLAAGDVLGSTFGDSPSIDLLPLQQALDELMSGATTNALNNAIQLIYSADPNLQLRTLSDGQKLVSAASPPSGLNLNANAADTYKLIDLLMQHQQLLSGVNDVARGNPNASLKSGTSLAVVLAQAIQYVNDLQTNYAQVAGDVATQLVDNIKTFSTEEMTAYIVGASRKGQVKTFKAKDLMNVQRISVDLGNPLTQSYAGRNELVSIWQQYGIIKDPKAIITFLRTGELDGATEDPFTDALRVREANELLRKGIVPKVLITDRHAELIVGAKAIMSSEEARENPAVVEAYAAYTTECLRLLRLVPPDLAAILAGQPLPPPQGPAPATNVPNPPNPKVDGASMPGLPPGTPPSVQANYQQALNAVPNQGAA